MKKKRFAIILLSAALTALLAGCGTGNDGDVTESASESSESSETSSGAVTELGEGLVEDIETGTRPLEEGDDYAINKINNKSSEDSLPGGYKLNGYTEELQGKMFTNGKSKIVIRAYNYKEDLKDLAVWADQACAITTISNITSACDTFFDEPENVQVMGFDAIKYNYTVVQYEFIPNPDDPDGEEIKSPIGTYKGIAYYFYSEQDAYAIMFDSAEADFEEQSGNFEKFMDDLEITKTEY